MAIALLTSAATTTDATTFTTASVTPTAGALQLLGATWTASVDPPDPTSIVGSSLAWSKIGTAYSKTSGGNRLTTGLFACYAPASPTTGTTVITFPSTVNGILYHWYEWPGMWLAQVKSDVNASVAIAGHYTPTALGNPQSANSRPFYVLGSNTTAGWTTEAGWTKPTELSYLTPSAAGYVAWHASSWDASPDATNGTGTATPVGMVYVELRDTNPGNVVAGW